MKVNRDQVVAASLVGTVVVVLGYASGLGRVPTPVSTQQEAIRPPAVLPEHATATTPPIVHIGQSLPRNPPRLGLPVTHPSPSHPSPTHPTPSHPDTTPPTSTPRPTPPGNTPPCDTDAIIALLAQLGALVGDLPLLADLPLPLPAVSDLPLVTNLPLPSGLTGVLPTAAPPALVTTTDNQQLNDLLGGCGLLVQPDGRIVGLVSNP